MSSGPQQEHKWLERLVGEWTYETEASMEPGKPPEKFTGSESVRSLGGVWVQCEMRGDVPDGGCDTSIMIMTLGYDPAKQRYVGSFIGTMMTHMWIYNGQLDPAGNVLTLDTEGPSPEGEGKMAKYKDVIELQGDDQRVLSSSFLGEDGAWHPIMKMTYRRAK